MSHDEFTYVIGHKNPDADAICSAIAYANLKILQGHKGCIPARCGNTNARIDTILAKFSQPIPLFVGDVSPRARDIMVRDVVKVCYDNHVPCVPRGVGSGLEGGSDSSICRERPRDPLLIWGRAPLPACVRALPI